MKLPRIFKIFQPKPDKASAQPEEDGLKTAEEEFQKLTQEPEGELATLMDGEDGLPRAMTNTEFTEKELEQKIAEEEKSTISDPKGFNSWLAKLEKESSTATSSHER